MALPEPVERPHDLELSHHLELSPPVKPNPVTVHDVRQPVVGGELAEAGPVDAEPGRRITAPSPRDSWDLFRY
ncbi:MAG: hypothetical protein QOI06_927 [Nocardioidaceae bacterium]|nr:hypothetical protein [Nocardioidaceae bacterium]